MYDQKVKCPTIKEVEKMNLKDAKDFLSNYWHQFAIIFERFEGAGKIRGNGLHVAQKLSVNAVKELEERWLE